MVTGFLALYLIFNWTPFVYIALGVGAGSLISPLIGDLIVKGWYKLAHILGWINTRILLSLIFYLFLFPIALLAKLSQKDHLKLRKKKRESLFVERDHLYTKKDLENTW